MLNAFKTWYQLHKVLFVSNLDPEICLLPSVVDLALSGYLAIPWWCLLKAQVTWLPKKNWSPFPESSLDSRQSHNPERTATNGLTGSEIGATILPKSGDLCLPSITPRCHRVSSNKCLPWFQPSTPLLILRGLQMQSIQRHATHSWSRSWQRPESQLLRLRRSMQRCLGSCEVLLSKSPIWWGSA